MIIRFFYNLGIHLFVLGIKIASIRNQKAKDWISGRKNQFDKIKADFTTEQNPIWIHCASLGEFEQGRPVIEDIKDRYPNKRILVTFFSPSGYEVRKNYELADWVYYLPSDSPRNVKQFLDLIEPEMAVFVKYEYWFNFLKGLNEREIPTYYISAIFRPNQLFFKKIGKWYSEMLEYITHFYVQNETSKKLLNSIGYHNVTISGDTRFDRVAKIVDSITSIDLVEKFVENKKVIVAGSTWRCEEAILAQYMRKVPDEKLILAPHEVNDEHINNILNLFGDTAITYSKAQREDISNKQVLVIDSYGLLTSLYQYGKVAVIGGGFGVGIHNILEAATFGMPIIFGNNYEKFQEAVELKNAQCAFPINNVEEFNAVMSRLLTDPETTKKISKNSAQYVQDNIGATELILSTIFS